MKCSFANGVLILDQAARTRHCTFCKRIIPSGTWHLKRTWMNEFHHTAYVNYCPKCSKVTLKSQITTSVLMRDRIIRGARSDFDQSTRESIVAARRLGLSMKKLKLKPARRKKKEKPMTIIEMKSGYKEE